MRNYAKNVIYTIQCKDPNITETYASQSTNLISRRRDHKKECNNITNPEYNKYVYRFIRENGGWDNWEVIWQYNYPCENKAQAILEKKKFIIKNNCQLNTNDWFYIKEPEIQVKDLTEEDIINQIKELEEKLEKKREKDRVRQKNLTPEQREEKRAKHRIENLTSEQRDKNNARARVANMTEEQKAKKKEKDKKYRANLSEAQKQKNREKQRVENMTEEQKAKKKEKNRLYREKQKLLKENKVVVI